MFNETDFSALQNIIFCHNIVDLLDLIGFLTEKLMKICGKNVEQVPPICIDEAKKGKQLTKYK